MAQLAMSTNSSVSFDSALSPRAPRLRAATMMKETLSARKPVANRNKSPYEAVAAAGDDYSLFKS